MPDLTPAHKVPRPLGTDPVGQGDDTARALAAHLEGRALTNIGALASGWTGNGIFVERYGRLVTVYVDTTKATFGITEQLTGASTTLPADCLPQKIIYGDGVSPADGARRGFNITLAGRVQAYGYAGTGGGIVGQVTFIAVSV